MENVVFVRSRRKTLSLTVDREGQVVVRMPYGMQQSRAINFLELHRDWVTRQIAARSKRLDISDGAEICLFGERLTIRNGKTARKGSELFLPEKGREEALANYTISLAKTYMSKLTEEVATHYGFAFSGVRISRARGRWGSCSVKGNITYSFRIAFLPLPVIRAVVVHELCHTRHMNHSAAFWQEVHKIVPNYAMVRKELKKYEFLMNSL
ncbi:MAG: M48 family metallopeptidase [Clostridia bacterium]|nr:M48 family metallopeptidase [Clostridia bacterium]